MMGKMLVVEDNPDVHELYQSIFDHLEVDFAMDGQQAIKALEQNQYALMLLDLHLPGVSGLDVLRYLRQDLNDQETIVLVVSSNLRLKPEAEAIGIDGWVTKPASPSDLVKLVERYHSGG